jgi:hypothetical protein
MKNVKYCEECGAKYEYNHAPPNFCEKCGNSLSRSASVNLLGKKSCVSKVRTALRGKFKEVEEGYTDADYVPDIDKLELEADDFDGLYSPVVKFDYSQQGGIQMVKGRFKKRDDLQV